MRSLARQTQDPVAWVVASLREDFKEELISRDARGRFASKKGGGGKRSAPASGKAGRRQSSSRRQSIATAAGALGGVAVAAAGAAALGGAFVVSQSRAASSDISEFDRLELDDPIDYSRYDDLEPGALLYKGFDSSGAFMHGGKEKGMTHWAVYTGRNEETGEHMVVECDRDPVNPGSYSIIERSIEESMNSMDREQRSRNTHFKPVPPEKRLPRQNTKPLSQQEILERADRLVGLPFHYDGVIDNCESIARAMVGDEPRTMQGEKVNFLGKKIMQHMFDRNCIPNLKKFGRLESMKTSKEMASLLSDYSTGKITDAVKQQMDGLRDEWRSKKAKASEVKENIYEAAVNSGDSTGSRRRKDSEDDGHKRLADLLGLEPIEIYAEKVEKIAQASTDKITQHLVRRQMWSNYFQLIFSTIHVTLNGKTGDLKQPRKDHVTRVVNELRSDDFTLPYWMTGDPVYKEMMAMAVVGSLRNDYKEELHPRDALGRFAKKGSGSSARQSVAGKGRKSSEEGGGSAWDRIAFPGGVATGLGIGALAVGGLAVAGGISGYQTIKEEGEKGATDVSHMDFPKKGAAYDFDRYDDLEPGTMIRKAFRFPGQTEGKAFLHYAVYVGKDDKTGEHMVVHAVPDPKDPTGTVAIVKQSIEDAVKRGGDHELENHSYYEAMPANERINGKGVPTMEEAVQRAESLIGQPYDYRSTRSNCESFARLITEGVAYETQGRGTASKAGMEMVANLTKVAQDYSRSRSKIWKGREPKDAHGYAELLAKMEAGVLSESARAVMAENRAAWESAPELPVGGATKRNLREMFEMALKDFTNPGRKRSDAEGGGDIFDLLGMKTPAEYQKDIDRACEGQSEPLRRETTRFMWSNYLQMFFALASDSKSPPKSLREDAERPWDEGKVKRGQGGRFAKKTEGGVTSGMASPVGGSAGQVKQLAPRRAAHYSSSVMDVIKAGEELLGQIVQDPAVKEKILRVAEEAAVVKAEEMRVRGEVIEAALAGDAEAAANGKMALNAIETKQKGLTDFFDDDMEIAQNLKSGFKAMAKGTELRGEVKFDEEGSDYSPEDRAKAKGMVEDAHRLFDMEPHTTVSMKKTTEMGEGRSCFRFDANEIQLSIEDESADDRTKQKTLEVTTFHEMGHSVQKSNPEIGALERQFLADRKTGALESSDARAKVGGVLVQTPDGGTATAVSMNALYGIEDVLHGNAPEASYGYGGTEIGVADSFVTPYVGTFHFEKTEENQSGETVASSGDMTAQFSEVFTVGVESMMRNPADFLKKDPDHFFLTLGLIAKQRSRAGRQDAQDWQEQKHPRDEMGRFATKANRNAMYSQVGQELGMPAEDVKVILKEHQTRISEKLKNQHGLVVDHDMGSGKTITAIAAAEEYGGAVVVVPASLRDNFKKELDKYGAEGKYEIHSYESFAKYKPSTEGRMLIVDEAHRLRNHTSERVKVIEEKGLEAEKVLLLTGTPIPNKPHDASVLVNIAAGEDLLPTSESGFNDRFMEKKLVVPNWFQRNFQKVPTHIVRQPKNLKEFKEKTAKYVDHYAPTKEGYPKVEEHSVEVRMTREQERIHRAWVNGAGRDIQLKIQKGIPLNAAEANRMNFFLNSQRQVANTAKKQGEVPPKIKAMMDRIESDSSGRPSVIYSNYLGSGVREVEDELKKKGISYASFTGEVSEKERKRIVDDYNSGKLKVLVISSSGGEGLDLKETSQIHIMEPHWHSEKLNQVAARAIRYKSHENLPEDQQKVEVYRYISTMSDKKDLTADQMLALMSQYKERMNSHFLEQWGHEPVRQKKRQDEDDFLEDSWEEEKHPRDAQGRFAPASSARQSATSREFLLGGGNAYAKSQGKKTGLAGDAISAGQSYTEDFADDPKFVMAQKRMAESQGKCHEVTARILGKRERGERVTPKDVQELNAASNEMNRVLNREFLPIATKKMEGVRNELLNDSPISKEEAKAIVGQRQIKGRPFPEPLIGFQVKGMLEEHTRLIGEDLPTFKKMDIYSLTYGRSYADPANGVVAIAGDQINKPIIFHEATHHMEASNPRALRTAEDWVKQRNRGRGEMPLSLVNPAYGPGERTMKDEFFNPYVGKLYKEGGKVEATEALSMGMQYFDSPKSMAMLYAVDPEHFHMTVGVIRPKGKGKSRKDTQEIRLDGLLSVPQGSSDYDKALIGRMNDNLKLDKKTGCFLWTASTRKDGYGQVKVNGELKSAHKVAYTLIKGKVPEGQLVCHRCDNPACCNPAHLFLGDSSKNVGDMVKKGRNSNGRGDSLEDLIAILREDAFVEGRHPRDERGRFTYKDGAHGVGVWYEGRRTPVLVSARSKSEALEKAAKLKRRGGAPAKVRRLTEQEERQAQKGKWVRTGPNGEKPGTLNIRGHGPKPKGFES